MWPAPSDGAITSEGSPSSRERSNRPRPPPPHRRSHSASESQGQRVSGPDPSRTPWRPTRPDPQFVDGPSPSSSADSPFGAMSPSATDRVFPIRSVVSVDPSPTPLIRAEAMGADEFPGMVPPTSRPSSLERSPVPGARSEVVEGTSVNLNPPDSPSPQPPKVDSQDWASHHTNESAADARWRRRSINQEGHRIPRQMQFPSDNASMNSQTSTGGSLLSREDEVPDLVTARFKHVVSDGGHAVIIGREGNTLQRCEDEPIHIPGAVQGFGLLIALKEVDEKLQVRIVSENSKRLIGYTPRQLFELDNFCDILSEDQTDNLLDHIDFIRDDDGGPAANGPEVFTMSIRAPSRKSHKVWCAMHINENNGGLIICEFELEDDPINPLVPAGEATPEPPEDTLRSEPTPEELAESTVVASKPLRVLRSARKRKGEAAAMEVFNIMSQVQEQLANASNLETFLKILVGVVKELTGFHRVMVYQFDSSWNGRVVTELVDPRATKDLYKGLNFPASDIPKQARDLYKINKVRLLYDRDQETARLVCRTAEDLENPLDLTFAYLRAMSPVHIKYLANMAVRSSMSISINAFHELWGLLACHSYGHKGMRVSFPIRKMCRLVGDSASRNIERLSYASRLQARKLINTASTESNPSGYIVASSDDLLKLFDADYGLLSIRDETKILGKLEHTQEALAMLEYLRLRQITSVTSSTDIRSEFPDLRYQPGFSVIAGLLLVPLTINGRDFIVFFRKGQVREVKWAGNPYEKFIKEGTEGYLEPRKSFRTWSETVLGKCKEWTEEQIDTAAVLCLVYGKFIEVWRQKETALQNSQLTKILLANSAHEVRTPLNAIINYLEIALEGQIDQETRDNLSRSHSASKSLIYVINDLLDLTKTEEGHDLIKDELFDLPATVREATDQFTGDARRKQLEYETIEHPGVPRFVIGDQRRVRQVISNVTANAIQHTSSGAVKIEVWLADRHDNRVDIDIVVQDTGVGMSASKLDALFNDLEQVQSEADDSLSEKLAPDNLAINDKDKSDCPKRVLGLGLALVARIVRNMNGQLRLKSEEGKGSRFVVQMSFEVPPEEPKSALLEGLEKAGIAPPSTQPSTPPIEKGEVMLIRSAQKRTNEPNPNDIGRQKSSESLKSFKSGSSTKSEVDRLIDAIQEPHLVSKSGESEQALTQSGTRSGHGRPASSSSSRRPSALSRSNSRNLVFPKSPEAAQQLQEGPGKATVTDSRTPVKPIRMPDELSTRSPSSEYPTRGEYPTRTPARVLFDRPDKPPKQAEPLSPHHLRVLVAEDDPINSKIIKKRLEKIGHEVQLTINGEECASMYCDKAAFFDVVLMDMQMPIVDGLTSTKMIRSHEKTNPSNILSTRAAINGRVPIFAVSASLIEKERQTYIDAGFDGWILKPIAFERLSVLLNGIVEEVAREACLYQAGKWEIGGWFCKRQPDVFSSSTTPSPKAPVSASTTIESVPAQPKNVPEDEERRRLNRLDTDAVHADSKPSNPGQSGHIEDAVEGSGS